MSSKDIVLLSTADWDNPFWTNKQHVAIELVRTGHRVFYIESLGLRRPSLRARDFRRIWKRLFKALRPPCQVRDNLWVWSPMVLPWHGVPVIRCLNRVLLSAGLQGWLKFLGLTREWLWTYNPLTTEFFDLESFNCRIYHCVDEIKAQPGMPVSLLEVAERQLAKKVDVIFTTSPQLTETRRKWNPNIYYFPNVADFDHFFKAQNVETTVPSDLLRISKPRIGFIGAVSGYKLDFNLIRKIAEKRRDWSLIFIGKVGEGDPWTTLGPLNDLPNIHFFGPRSYEDLPNYLKGFDVAMLPNNLNEYTEAMFPMKFFEYLAAGKPIVSVDLPALRKFNELFYIAEDENGFINAIEKSLTEDKKFLAKRLKVAREHTYKNRTDKMLNIIFLKTKPN